MLVASGAHNPYGGESTAASVASADGSRRQRLGSIGGDSSALASSSGDSSEAIAPNASDWNAMDMVPTMMAAVHHRQSLTAGSTAPTSTYRLSGQSVPSSTFDSYAQHRQASSLGVGSIGTAGSIDDEQLHERDDETGVLPDDDDGGDALAGNANAERDGGAGGTLSEDERGQMESFFAGLGTEIFVSPSMANLYEGCGPNDWRLVYTGVPVLLHDRGRARSRAQPTVSIVLAERGTCFAMWQDRIDYASAYKIAGPAFHTMCLSTDRTKLIGFSYDSNGAAHETWQCVDRLMSDPAFLPPAELNTTAGKKQQRSAAKQRQRLAKQQQQQLMPTHPLPPKSQISAPCQFQHVTSVQAHDVPRFFSLQAFLQAGSLKQRSH